MEYPRSYHAACTHLIQFGGHGGDRARRRAARLTIATALRALRRQIGHERARWHRRHLLFISGMFPIK